MAEQEEGKTTHLATCDAMLNKSHRNSLLAPHRLYTCSRRGGENHFTVIIILYRDPSTRIHHDSLAHNPAADEEWRKRANNKTIVNLGEGNFYDVYRSGALLVACSKKT